MNGSPMKRSRLVRVIAGAAPVLISALVFTLAVTPVLADEQLTQLRSLNAHDYEEYDQHGWSVDIDGSTIVSGAWQEDSHGSNAGAAYVFVDNGTLWFEQAKLTHSSLNADDRFGVAVAVSGDNAVVGADGDDGGGAEAGTAYAFTRASESWGSVRVLTPSDPTAGDQFGISVAVSGDTAVVGAPHKSADTSQGAVYVFTKSGSNWTQQQKLTASDGFAGDLFGMSVAIDGDTLVVGAPNDDDAGAATGSAYVFTRSAGVWTERTKLVPGTLVAGDEFGTDVAIDGTLIAAGAPERDEYGLNRGVIFVYSGSGASWSGPTALSDGGGQRQGASLDLDDGVVVSDIRSTNRVCMWRGSGLAWEQHAPIRSDAWSVGVSGDIVVLGDHTERVSGETQAGSLHMYEFPPGSSPLTYWDSNVSVTFSSLTAPGYPGSGGSDVFEATLRLDSVNPAPTGYVMTEQTLFDLWTNASYSGTFTVSIPYHDSNVPNWLNSDGPVAEADLKMLHWNGASWDDITSSVDTATNRVYGIASSMSEFVIVETGEATSNPYWDWDPAGANAGSLGTPHKDYRLTTQKCAVCHAVHQANPDGELLLPTTRANACIYCHITTTLGGIVIYGGDPDNYLVEDDFGHQYDGGAGVACADCHSVHGADTMGGDAGLETKILRAGGYQSELVAYLAGGDETSITTGGQPGNNTWGPQDWNDFDTQFTAFCTKCHQNYSETSTQTIAATGMRTHPMRVGFDDSWASDPAYPDRFGLGVTYVWYLSTNCVECHGAYYESRLDVGNPGLKTQSFPHQNPGYAKLLAEAADLGDAGGYDVPTTDPSGDGVCVNCHIWEQGGSLKGAGETY